MASVHFKCCYTPFFIAGAMANAAWSRGSMSLDGYVTTIHCLLFKISILLLTPISNLWLKYCYLLFVIVIYYFIFHLILHPIISNLIALSSSSPGENASIKSFEIMAWILHEPRLVAEVPVFCVCAIQPLLESKRSPNTVSIGTVKLLYHLHARLEVLVKSENILYDDIDRDTPVLWEVRSVFWEYLRKIFNMIAESHV